MSRLFALLPTRIAPLAFCLATAFCPGVAAAEHWIRLSTPHFEMYTTNGEKQGTAALKVFEQVRYFFLQSSHSKTAPDTPVRIVAFRSEKEYKPYRSNEGAFAYYLRSRKVDYIVMQDISPEHYQAAMHEYTHLIVEHQHLDFPVWLNEGVADLYSSLEPKGSQALVGRPIAGRAQVLMNARWLSLQTLFAVTPDSPYYNESDKMSIFYAESWALTHMLALGRDYMSGFTRFLIAIESGQSAPDALATVFHKNLTQVMLDLQAYLHQSSVQAALFNVELSKTELEPVVTEPSEWNVSLALADLLAAQKKTVSEAAQRLAQLSAARPDDPEVEESLGYLAWQQGDVAQARKHFQASAQHGSKNPEMLLDYAQLLRQSGGKPEEVVPLLRRVVELKPDNFAAWQDLGMTFLEMHQWGSAFSALSRVTTIKKEQAFPLFAALAYCHYQLKDMAGASADAEKAKQYATSPDQIFQADNLLKAAQTKNATEPSQVTRAALPATPAPSQSDAPPTSAQNRGDNALSLRETPVPRRRENLQHVEAIVKTFECSSTQAMRLHVTVDGKAMTFLMPDPKEIVVRNTAEGYFDFSCGAQKPLHIGIFYVPPTRAAEADGVLRELVF